MTVTMRGKIKKCLCFDYTPPYNVTVVLFVLFYVGFLSGFA